MPINELGQRRAASSGKWILDAQAFDLASVLEVFTVEGFALAL
jgi:hypothetical protein